MNNEKKYIVITIMTALFTILLFFGLHKIDMLKNKSRSYIKVGFVFDGDESTPYTGNFVKTAGSVKSEFGDRVEIIIKNNVPYSEASTVIKELVNEKCDIIFTNSYGYQVAAKEIAKNNPKIQFCQATGDNANETPKLKNYHTFMGKIYEGRYVAGKVAGLKLNELIKNGDIKKEQALVGYVGAYSCAEVISGFTAFFLGIKSECPSAKMKVRYTNTWTSYAKEKEISEKLIQEGCVIISQHSDTIGPAVACENSNSDLEHPVYHVGYNQDMIDAAPTTSLVSCRINWEPYIRGAIQAVIDNQKIEEVIDADINGNDAGAGFERDWVQMLELNQATVAKGSREMVKKTIDDFENKSCYVFKGNFTGVNPDDSDDIIDLNKEYKENNNQSAPTFNYILDDVIQIEED